MQIQGAIPENGSGFLSSIRLFLYIRIQVVGWVEERNTTIMTAQPNKFSQCFMNEIFLDFRQQQVIMTMFLKKENDYDPKNCKYSGCQKAFF